MTPSFWRGRRVLLTGHTGFKGAWASIMLADLGAKVSAFSLPPPDQSQSVAIDRRPNSHCRQDCRSTRPVRRCSDLLLRPARDRHSHGRAGAGARRLPRSARNLQQQRHGFGESARHLTLRRRVKGDPRGDQRQGLREFRRRIGLQRGQPARGRRSVQRIERRDGDCRQELCREFLCAARRAGWLRRAAAM